MQMKILYSAEDDQKPLASDRKQNHLILCDAETGIVYKATDIVLDASKLPPGTLLLSARAEMFSRPKDNLNVIGYVKSQKMIFFESYKGPTGDITTQMIASDLSPAERDRVLTSKKDFDSGYSTPLTARITMAELRNG